MLLKIYSIGAIATTTLTISLSILVLAILYKKYLAHLRKGEIKNEDYAVLYPIEIQPAKGEIEFYYELEQDKEILISLLDQDMKEVLQIDQRLGTVGGNKVIFDTKQVANGLYFYQLKSDNQQTMKKIAINNP